MKTVPFPAINVAALHDALADGFGVVFISGCCVTVDSIPVTGAVVVEFSAMNFP